MAESSETGFFSHKNDSLCAHYERKTQDLNAEVIAAEVIELYDNHSAIRCRQAQTDSFFEEQSQTRLKVTYIHTTQSDLSLTSDFLFFQLCRR